MPGAIFDPLLSQFRTTDQSIFDGRYVLKSGDTMVGPLIVQPNSSAGTGAIRINQNANDSSNGLRIVNSTAGTQANIYINASSGTPLIINSGSSGAGNMALNSGGGLVGIGTVAPTHTLTLPSTATGIAAYNTVDQTTNYERNEKFWSGTTYYDSIRISGTGSYRAMRWGTFGASGTRYLNSNVAGGNGFIQAVANNLTSGESAFRVSANAIDSTGIQYAGRVSITANQSGTSGYTALLVESTENSIGSGAKLLADFQVGGSTKASIDNLGNINTGGYVMANGSYSATPSSPGVYMGIPATLNARFTMVPNSGDIRAIDNSAGNVRIVNSSQGTIQMISSPAGLTSFGGNTTPTAVLDARASSTTSASLRIRSGVAPTAPNDGDIWYDGTNLLMRVGGTTKTFTLV